MKKNLDHHKPTNFWFGFSLGIITTGVGVYLLGTGKGRENLKKLLELSENLPEKLPNLINEIENKIETKLKENNTISTIENVIKKVKESSEDKTHKKFFFKSS